MDLYILNLNSLSTDIFLFVFFSSFFHEFGSAREARERARNARKIKKGTSVDIVRKTRGLLSPSRMSTPCHLIAPPRSQYCQLNYFHSRATISEDKIEGL